MEEKEIENKIDITGKDIPKLDHLVPDSDKTGENSQENNIHADKKIENSKTQSTIGDYFAKTKVISNDENNLENVKNAVKLSEMDPKDRFIKELLDIHGKEEENPEHIPQWWDHPAQKDPMLILMSWEQIRKVVLNLFPQIGMENCL